MVHLLHRALGLYRRERRLIVYDLHDGLAQYLAGALISFQTYQASQGADSKTSDLSWEKGLNLLNRGITELRYMMRGLQPSILEKCGIMAAVANLIELHRNDYGIEIHFRHAVHFNRLAPPLEYALYRVLQESLGNACRHSHSKKIWVKIIQRGRRIRLKVCDLRRRFRPGKCGQETLRTERNP